MTQKTIKIGQNRVKNFNFKGCKNLAKVLLLLSEGKKCC